MMLIDNLNYLKQFFPRALETLEKEQSPNGHKELYVTDTRNGELTLYKDILGNHIYAHSKYNPISEATAIIDKYSQIDDYDHVLFYGLGLGFHIDEFVKRYPDKSYSIYEPSLEAFNIFCEHKLLSNYSTNQLKTLHIERDSQDIPVFLGHFLKLYSENTLFIILPSYERLFAKQFEQFSSEMSRSKLNRVTHLYANLKFEKRWTLNSLLNFKETIACRNIFHHEPGFLKDKPVLLVAAGPSLQYEIDHLRRIKDRGLAYIVSVGSAIKALVSYGIHPDFACTYDPLEYNQYVFDEVVEQNITTIPLIYGTSVGFEILEKYPGPKYHMLTSQDTVGSFYLENKTDGLDIVSDAASIAIITLQLLARLGASPIILVGQNFAYKEDQFYAAGVNSRFRGDGLTDRERNTSIEVEDVEGNQIYSNAGLTRMKGQMEDYIKIMKQTEFINTTRGGAKIAGTTYIPLQVVQESRLHSKTVVEGVFSENKSMYDNELIGLKVEEMYEEFKKVDSIFQQITKLLDSLRISARDNKQSQLKKHFARWDKMIRRLRRNKFYDVFLQPMNRVKFELLLINVDKIRFQEDIVGKANLIVTEFGNYIKECYDDLELLSPIYEIEHEKIISKLSEGSELKDGL